MPSEHIIRLRAALETARTEAFALVDQYGDMLDGGDMNASYRYGMELAKELAALLDHEAVIHFEDKP